MKNIIILFVLLFSISCTRKQVDVVLEPVIQAQSDSVTTSLILLGTIQDAGYPQIGCKKLCCTSAFGNHSSRREVVSLGLVDVSTNKTFMFEATPDIVRQMREVTSYETHSDKEIVDGIFLTHAHIGHYTGLMYLGKEAISADSTPVYVMPRMKEYLETNGPWSQLVSRGNINLHQMTDGRMVKLSADIQVTPFLVPHRDEFSETVGYRIEGPSKTALFIPDIDKWEKWDKDILEEIRRVDYAFLDATFYSGKEINNRDISEIPHPFIIESLETFKPLSEKDKNKVVFIHFNHTNPVIDLNSKEAKRVLEEGYHLGRPNDVFDL